MSAIIRHGTLLLGILLLPALARAAEPALLRSTQIVADVDRSIAFYEQLGFAVESDRSGPRKAESPFPLASRSTRFRLVILKSADPEGGRLGLLSFADVEPPVLVPYRDRLGIGYVVHVVRHPDADALFRSLQAGGARLVEPEPVPYEAKRPDGGLGRGRLFHVFDPDGRLIEVMSPAVDEPPAGQ
jgi:catechol 2,3-dioxygenase-like lactoylglutathione lyase family enzyme